MNARSGQVQNVLVGRGSLKAQAFMKSLSFTISSIHSGFDSLASLLLRRDYETIGKLLSDSFSSVFLTYDYSIDFGSFSFPINVHLDASD
jgi:hypothetical protein